MEHTCQDCKHRSVDGHERFNGDCIDLYFLCSKKSKQGVKVSVTLDHKICNEFELKDEK